MSTIIALQPLLHQLQGRQSVENRSQKVKQSHILSFASIALALALATQERHCTNLFALLRSRSRPSSLKEKGMAAGLAQISFLSSGCVNQLESSGCDYPMLCQLLIIVPIKVQIRQKSDYLSFI